MFLISVFGGAPAYLWPFMLLPVVGAVGYWRASAPPKDKRTLAEKNWDWIMGPELPSTCKTFGHSYVIDPHECDWCHAERWVEVRATQGYDTKEPYWSSFGLRVQFVTDGLEKYQIVGSNEEILIMPASTEVVDAFTNEHMGTAGIVFDSVPSSMRSSEYEAREYAQVQAQRSAKRDAAIRNFEARRQPRPSPLKSEGRPPSSHPRGSDVKADVERLKHLRAIGFMSERELKRRLKDLMEEAAWYGS